MRMCFDKTQCRCERRVAPSSAARLLRSHVSCGCELCSRLQVDFESVDPKPCV